MKRLRKWLVSGSFLVVGAMLVFYWHNHRLSTEHSPKTPVSLPNLLGLLGGDGFPQVASHWKFRFPADHGSHEDYRTEWWHLTGVLEDKDARPLGVQLLLIRFKLRPVPPASPSKWATSTIYGGLFTHSHPAGGQLIKNERLTRKALDLAGTEIDGGVNIWLENWRIEEVGSADGALNLKLYLAANENVLKLRLRNLRPLLDANKLRGDAGQIGAPFQFYIQPRLRADGHLIIDGQENKVSGLMTFEHAWGELPLPGGAVALDRFTLYLDDERELFLIRRHRVDGESPPTTTGILLESDQEPVTLSDKEISLNAIDHWTSAQTGIRYPISWSLKIPLQGIDIEFFPSWNNQESHFWNQPFWSGPILVNGDGTDVAGPGLMQLNGYTAK